MTYNLIEIMRKWTGKKINAFPFMMFWIGAFLLLCWLDRDKPVEANVMGNAVNVVSYAFLVYINIVYLIPQYLNEQRFVDYILFLLCLVVLVTPIKIYLSILLLKNYPNYYLVLIKSWSLLLLLDFLVLTGSTIYSIVSDWLIKRIEINELQKSQVESELNFLKSQINPHFMFNTLNSIYGLSLKKSDRVSDAILRLSESLRYMLYDCNERRVQLAKEIKYLENYIALEHLRYGDDIKVDLKVEGDLSNYSIAPLILNGFVENAFKHGISRLSEGAFIDIIVRIDEEGLMTFSVLNNMDEKPSQVEEIEKPTSGGIGLQNVKRRLEILYQNDYLLEIKPMKDLYQIILKINLKK